MKKLRFEILKITFYKILAKILVKYLAPNLSSLKLNLKLKSKDHIINKLLTTVGDLTSSKLKSKDKIIHKLINQNNCEENSNRASINQSSHPIPRMKTIQTIQIKIAV